MVFVAKQQRETAEDDETRSITFRVTEDDLWAALKEYRGRFRIKPAKTDIMLVALQDFLRSENAYPPKKKRADA